MRTEKAVFDDLEQGMYLVLQGISMPTVHLIRWSSRCHTRTRPAGDYDVEFEPKVNTVTTLGRIEVTKKIKGLYGGMLQDISADSATYHIGLFVDANGEHLLWQCRKQHKDSEYHGRQQWNDQF